MFSWLTKGFLVAALVLSLGFHWAVLQSLAWADMAVNFSKDNSVATALAKTFDGKHPCKMCNLVAQGKKAERESQSKLDVKKLDSFLAAAATYFFVPLKQNPLSQVSVLSARIDVPLSPPPRLG